MMQKEEVTILMVFPLVLFMLVSVLRILGVEMLIIGFVFLGLGAVGFITTAALFVQGKGEGAFIIVPSVLLAIVGGVTAALASSM